VRVDVRVGVSDRDGVAEPVRCCDDVWDDVRDRVRVKEGVLEAESLNDKEACALRAPTLDGRSTAEANTATTGETNVVK
jgi:hypothetical protein